MEIVNKEQEIKSFIKDCPIDELEQYAIIMQKEERRSVNVMDLFKLQTKETLEEQKIIWDKMLFKMCDQHKEDGALKLITEENQDTLSIKNSFTNKENVYLYYKLGMEIDYYKNCITLMKKLIKNK